MGKLNISANDFDPQAYLKETSSDDVDTQAEAVDDVPEPSDGEELSTEESTEDTQDEGLEPNEETNEENDSTEDVSVLKKELENYKKRYENLEKLRGRQTNELGELRKQVQQLLQAQQNPSNSDIDAEYVDNFIKNPKQAIIDEINRRDAQRIEQQTQESESVSRNLTQIYQSVPNFDELKDTILSIAKEDDGIQNANMAMLEVTMKTDPILAVQYAKRAILKKQLEETTKKGKQTVEQLASNSKRPKPISSGASQQSTKKSLETGDLSNLSDAELKKMMKKYGL